MNLPNLQKIKGSETWPAGYSRILPFGWAFHGLMAAGLFFSNSFNGLRVLVSLDEMDDGGKWLHVSCSHEDKLPSWDDLKTVKELFIGSHREAVQIFPKARDYINLMPYCLHLWAHEE